MGSRATSWISRLAPFGFFLALLAWIGTRTALSFPEEFPALHLLCKWDCGWYESIARQGYVSPIPPIHQSSEHSNVAFFPAYPLLGRTLAGLLGLPLTWALPLVSILFAIGVSAALHRLLADESRGSRLLRQAVLVAYPATFYLFVSYSEALYLATMLGGAALLVRRDGAASGVGVALLAASGFLLGATRLTGFVIPGFLLLGAIVASLGGPGRARGLAAVLADATVRRAALFLGAAVAAIGAFFLFCQLRFGHWNLYFWQLSLGWYKEFSPAKAFQILVGVPYPPVLDRGVLLADSRRLSWTIIATLTAIGLYAVPRAIGTARRAFAAADRPTLLRCFLVFAAYAHFFIVVCGDVGPWDVWGNGLRYPMPTVFLLAVAWRDEWTPAFVRARPGGRYAALAALAIVLAYLFSLEAGYLVRFIRNEWVS